MISLKISASQVKPEGARSVVLRRLIRLKRSRGEYARFRHSEGRIRKEDQGRKQKLKLKLKLELEIKNPSSLRFGFVAAVLDSRTR